MIEDKELNEAIEEINQDIIENRNKIKHIKSFNTKLEKLKSGKGTITEEEYHYLCETPLRYTDILGKSLIYVIPGLEYKKRHANFFVYTLDGYNISIPNSRQLGIDIYLDNFTEDIENYICYVNRCHRHTLTNYNKAIESNIDILSYENLISKSKIYVKDKPDFMKPFYYVMSDLSCRLAYKHSLEKELKNQLEELRKEKEQFLKDIKHKYKIYHEEQIKLHNYLDKYLPILHKWTDTVRVHGKDSIVTTYKLKTI